MNSRKRPFSYKLIRKKLTLIAKIPLTNYLRIFFIFVKCRFYESAIYNIKLKSNLLHLIFVCGHRPKTKELLELLLFYLFLFLLFTFGSDLGPVLVDTCLILKSLPKCADTDQNLEWKVLIKMFGGSRN